MGRKDRDTVGLRPTTPGMQPANGKVITVAGVLQAAKIPIPIAGSPILGILYQEKSPGELLSLKAS